MASFNTLPAELLLEIIPQVAYSPQTLTNLHLTNKRLHTLIQSHEKSLVKSIQLQLPPTTLALFPGIPSSYPGLQLLHTRLQTIETMHSTWLRITSHGPDLSWLRSRWENVHRAGMYLLYRLQDAKTHQARLELLESLPATSSACLLFKLFSGVKILRIYGPEPIHAGFAKGDDMLRCEVELACEEMLLQRGPEYFMALLGVCKTGAAGRECDRAVEALKTELLTMESRQLPIAGNPQPPTLISTLRRSFATKMECHIAESRTRMWETLSSTAFDSIDEEKMVRLVNGVGLEKGMRRMGI